MGFVDKAKQVGAALSLATNVYGTALPNSVNTDLVRQHAKYSKEVRLPDTRREISRTLDRASRSKEAELKQSTKMSNKDLKKLK